MFRGGARALVLAVALPALAALASDATAQGRRDRLDVRLFARIPAPGQPEPVAVGPDGNVYVGTNQQGDGDAAAPSEVFVLSAAGRLLRRHALRGQKLDDDHGIQGLAFDAYGLLYVLDRAADPRVVVLDTATREQRDYARFRDVPSCGAAGRQSDCSATVGDRPAAPDYEVFGPDGSLYVTDIEQALIWRVPRGGGRPEVWFTDPRLENLFGPNGIQFEAGGRRLLFAVSAVAPIAGDPTSGRLYELPVRPDGRPGELTELWRSRSLDGPDGFAIGRSGTIYLALAVANQIAVISPRGEELTRVPATPADNAQMEVPFDGPASLAFLGERVLISNQTFPTSNPQHWAVLDLFAGEFGLPLFRPRVAPAGARRVSCLRAALRFGRGRLGPLRLGRRRGAIRRAAGAPSVRRRGAYVYCVRGGGRVTVAFSRRGGAALIATTASGHTARGVHRGSPLRRVVRAFPRARRVSRRLYVDRRTGTVFGVRRGRVGFVAMLGRRRARSPARRRAYLRRAGLPG